MDYFDDEDLEAEDALELEDQSSYLCHSCGEEIVVPVDLTAGQHQQYVEDCPVCCHPNVIRVDVDPSGQVHLSSDSEQDRF